MALIAFRSGAECAHVNMRISGNSPPAILLRESYRGGNKVRKRTLLNLTSWPRGLVEGFRALLKGGTVIPAGQEPVTGLGDHPTVADQHHVGHPEPLLELADLGGERGRIGTEAE